jgi:hypothetical protein
MWMQLMRSESTHMHNRDVQTEGLYVVILISA